MITSKPIENQVEKIERHIQTLPLLEDDTFPFLPKEMFAVSKLEGSGMYSQIAYRSIIIHFGISMKQLDEDIDLWIDKYEQFLFNLPRAWESIVHIKINPYTGHYPMNRLQYFWSKESKKEETIWRFKGDPKKWDALTRNRFLSAQKN